MSIHDKLPIRLLLWTTGDILTPLNAGPDLTIINKSSQSSFCPPLSILRSFIHQGYFCACRFADFPNHKISRGHSIIQIPSPISSSATWLNLEGFRIVDQTLFDKYKTQLQL